MSIFQLLMLGMSAFFAFKIYEHIHTLEEPTQNKNNTQEDSHRFDAKEIVDEADEAFENGELEKALSLLEEVIRYDKHDDEVLFKLGYISQQLEKDNDAIDYYKQALEINPSNEFIHNALASIYRKNGEFTSAKIHLHNSIELDDKNPITYYNYGNLLVDMKREDEAVEMYKKALLLKPDFIEAKEEINKILLDK